MAYHLSQPDVPDPPTPEEVIVGRDFLTVWEELKDLKEDHRRDYEEYEEELAEWEKEELDERADNPPSTDDYLNILTDDSLVAVENNLTEMEKVIDDVGEDTLREESLIAEDCFEEYARQLAEDLGAIDRKAVWPLNHIDWAGAAEELKSDYIEVKYQGWPYLIRSI